MSLHDNWPEAGVVGAFHGVAESFPVPSLGYSVVIPARMGGPRTRYVVHRSLPPSGAYCLVAGPASVIRFTPGGRPAGSRAT